VVHNDDDARRHTRRYTTSYKLEGRRLNVVIDACQADASGGNDDDATMVDSELRFSST